SFSLYVGNINVGRFGSSYDDTIYVTAAKSLATGEGYQVTNLPHPVPQTVVPPLYPFLLSIIWRISPQFPENLPLMMFFSVLLMMAYLLLSYRYIVVNNYATRWQALAVVALTAINWRMMNFAIEIISDILFIVLSMIVLHLSEQYSEGNKPLRIGVLLGILAGLLLLTRISGLGLIASLGAYYLYRRQWKKLSLPLVIATIFLGGWITWCSFKASEVSGEHASYYSGYLHGIAGTVDRLQAVNDESMLATY